MQLLNKIKTLKKYSFIGLVSLGCNFLYTRLVLSKAFLVRRPAHVRVVGQLDFGKGFMAGPGLILDVLDEKAILRLGNNVKFNHRVHVAVLLKVEIGDDCLFGSNILVTDHAHGIYNGAEQSSPLLAPNARPLDVAPISIGERVWIGDNSVVLHGTTIGSGSIIGANSVVKGSIPSNVIAVGSPAKPIKRWDEVAQKWLRL